MPLMVIMWQFPLWLFPLLTPEGTIMWNGAFQFKNMKVIVSTGNRGMSLILYAAMRSHQPLLHPNRKTVRLLSRPIFSYVTCVSNPHTRQTSACLNRLIISDIIFIWAQCVTQQTNQMMRNCHVQLVHLTASFIFSVTEIQTKSLLSQHNFTLLVQMRSAVITLGSSEKVHNECCQGHLLLYQLEPGGVKLALLSNAQLTTWRTRISDGHMVTTTVRCQIIGLCYCQ